MSSGNKANTTGTELEDYVEYALKKHGFGEFWIHKAQAFKNRKTIGGKQYIKQLNVGTTIYQSIRRVDFFVVNKQNFPDDLVIECKWQQAAGSVDEKYPFLLLNILKTGVPTIIVLDGGGYKPAAKKWLVDQVDKEEHRVLIGVWDMAEFQKKVNNGFFG